jgi:small subunit ribosomal protein S1
MSPLDRRGAVNADVLSPDGLSSKGVSLGDNIQEAGSTDYARLLDQYGGMGDLVEGEVVKGKVLKVTSSEVIVDVGYKSEGMISIEEFIGLDGSIDVKPGDEIDVLLEFAEDHEGHVVLSREKAERIKAWDGIEKAFTEQSILTGVVIDRIKGGLSVDIGVKAFLPGSQIDVKPVKNLDNFRGQTVECKVIKISKRRGNIVLSRKIVLEEQQSSRKRHILDVLQEGSIVSGTVKNITDYGVFVDLGGIDGLLHITDISWGRVNHPARIFSLGSQIKVKVLKFDREKERVSLGYKQLLPDPWASAAERYGAGTRVQGRVVSLTDYGAFLEIEEGIEGLVHVSEMSWNKRIKSPSKLLSLGDILGAVVLDVNAKERRMSLGLKQIAPDPWTTVADRYSVGTLVTGRVRNLTDFGAFIEVEDGIDGLVHISDLSWTRKLKHPSEILKKGDQVNVVVLHIDAENHRLSLGIKQLQPDGWEEFISKYQIGDLIRGTVLRFTSFGVFVELENGIEGLCHISQLEEKGDPTPKEPLAVGESYDFKIIKLQPHEKKIGLSLKAVTEPTARQEIHSYVAKASAQAASTIGEMTSLQQQQADDMNKQ